MKPANDNFKVLLETAVLQSNTATSLSELTTEELVKLIVKQCVIICHEVGDIARKGCQVSEADVCAYKIEHFFSLGDNSD